MDTEIKEYDFKKARMLPLEEVFSVLQTSQNGLANSQAQERLAIFGLNEIETKKRRKWWEIFLQQFKNPLALILIFASLLSGFLGDSTETVIIIAMVFLSSLMGFIQEYKAETSLAKLNKKIVRRATVIRDNKTQEINVSELVPGDIVSLSLGAIVPADLRLIETHDLSLNEAILTGESFPAEKDAEAAVTEDASLVETKNMVFAGANVATGSGCGVVVATGKETELGKTARHLEAPAQETEFQKGIKNFGNFLMRVIFYLVIFVFFVNALLRRGLADSALFALALAVGITPELLPVIITINLSRGAALMAKKKVIVKRLMSIEDLGNADILCTDKTGTLTEGAITLADYENLDGKQEEQIFFDSLICNLVITGLPRLTRVKAGKKIQGPPLDTASWSYAEEKKINLSVLNQYQRLDEMPFDFKRRRTTVAVEKDGQTELITKGSFEKVMEICQRVFIDGQEQPKKDWQEKITRRFEVLSQQGFRILALARKKTVKKSDYNFADEKDFVLFGFLMFYDKPKESAKESLVSLKRRGVEVKILTGDNVLVTRHICEELGFKITQAVSGEELDGLDSEKLKEAVNKANVFFEVTPENKLKITEQLKSEGHTVAFLGDGINDAPALKAADVGISVDTAADVARAAADVILLQKGLHVVLDGIEKGRETFGNTIKYIFNTISANYGNMFSFAAASIFLPFLPLLPSQILLNNFLSDVPNLAISTDKVDKDYLKKPKHWNIKAISRFMTFFGLISSLFDVITFVTLYFILRANVALFRTGWFIESSLSEIIILFAIRTRRAFFKSRPSSLLVVVSILSMVVAVGIAYLGFGQKYFEFAAPPLPMLGLIFLILAGYFCLVEWGKKIFYRKFEV